MSELVLAICKHGFPEATPEQEAVETAERAALEMYEGARVMNAEVIRTQAHQDAREFLVKVTLGQSTTPDPHDT